MKLLSVVTPPSIYHFQINNNNLPETPYLSLYLILRPFFDSVTPLLPSVVLPLPPQTQTVTLNPLRPSTQIKYQVCFNILCNGCLPPLYIFPHCSHPPPPLCPLLLGSISKLPPQRAKLSYL